MTTPQSSARLASDLLAWYDRHHRRLPWRVEKGETADPYRVWLSEIMLQQTTVAAVTPYFEAFLDRWPGVADLATADLDEVLHAWQGLGYYARARNLHKCARVVAEEYGGTFPDREERLRALPGIGAYTAAAIAAIVFGRATAPVDGNVVRVLSRLLAIATPLPKLRGEVEKRAPAFVPAERPGDFAQALMDLGATVCTPRAPDCPACPWSGACAARAEGAPERYPVKAPKKEKPTRYGTAFWLTRKNDGAVWLRRRPEKGLLGGMMEIPSTEWAEAPAPPAPPVNADWQELPGTVRHTFSHFHLELTVWSATTNSPPNSGTWALPQDLGDHALPTVMKKVVRLAADGDRAQLTESHPRGSGV